MACSQTQSHQLHPCSNLSLLLSLPLPLPLIPLLPHPNSQDLTQPNLKLLSLDCVNPLLNSLEIKTPSTLRHSLQKIHPELPLLHLELPLRPQRPRPPRKQLP